MHYYKFNIADWSLHTAHLSPAEEAIYFRLINYYYDTEKPIPEETQPVTRRLRLETEGAAVSVILDEFFTLKDGNWFHSRCEKEIKAFKKKAKVNKSNGAKGGRPPTSKGLESNPGKTQTVSESNPDITLTTNHKPLTNNHKPLTNIKRSPAKADIDFSPFGMSDYELTEVKRIRIKNKGGALTQRVVNGLSKEFHQAAALGYTFDELLTEWESRGWKSLKSEWFKPKTTANHSATTTQNINNIQEWLDE